MKDLMAAATAMRIHVEGEKQLNSTLQFQLAEQQRLAADLGRAGFFYSVVHLHWFHINADPDPAFHSTHCVYGCGSRSREPIWIRIVVRLEFHNKLNTSMKNTGTGT